MAGMHGRTPGSCPGKIVAHLAAPTEVPALLPVALVPVVRPSGSFEEHP